MSDDVERVTVDDFNSTPTEYDSFQTLPAIATPPTTALVERTWRMTSELWIPRSAQARG